MNKEFTVNSTVNSTLQYVSFTMLFVLHCVNTALTAQPRDDVEWNDEKWHCLPFTYNIENAAFGKLASLLATLTRSALLICSEW